jgi:hypothetical protein
VISGDDNVVPMQAAAGKLRKAFLGWQCRIRQLAMRDSGGRPTSGMQPVLQVGGQDAGRITVVMARREGEAITSELRHLVKRTQDPKERLDAALRYFQSSYFQDPTAFDDQLTAVFGIASSLPAQLSGRADCVLTFEQFRQVYELTCSARLLDTDDVRYQATYWHNALFNPSMPGEVQIVRFTPDWGRARARPQPA